MSEEMKNEPLNSPETNKEEVEDENSKNKLKQFNIRLTPSELKLLKSKSDEYKITPSDLIREAIKFYKPAVSLIVDDYKKNEAIEDVIRLELRESVKEIISDTFKVQLETTFMRIFNDIRKKTDFSFLGNNTPSKLSDQEDILNLLKISPKTIAEIIEDTRIERSGSEIYQLLKKMEKDKLIHKDGDKYLVV